MRSFLSLLVSFALISLGDVANLAIANNISFAAIGALGAYYTVSWLTNEFSQFGTYTYRIARRDEWQYLQVAVLCGLAIGVAVTLLSGTIPLAFGIDEEQRSMLSSMLVLYVVFQPVKAFAVACAEMVRLRGMLSQYRRMVVLFYVGSIPLNLLLFLTWHAVAAIIVAQLVGNLLMGLYGAYHLHRDKSVAFGWLTTSQLALVARYGAPLVGERLVQRVGLTVYGVCASYLPAEMYAVHSICLQAVYMGDIGDSAYSAALLVLVPDKSRAEDSKERYLSERSRMIAYRRKTAWVAVLFSFGASYLAAFIMHAEADLVLVMWFTFFYAFSFIPMCTSTPGKDFLTIQKQPVKVMIATMCGVPFYIGLPLVAIFLAPESWALYLFGLTGTAQILVRAAFYTICIRRMDARAGISLLEARKLAGQVDIEEAPRDASLGTEVEAVEEMDGLADR